jgi:hypothetical protein
VLANGREVPLLVANTADRRAVVSLLADAEAHKLRTSFYLALGVLGDPAAIPFLLVGLTHEGTVREAAAALAVISGAELWESVVLQRVAPDDELFAEELARRKAGDQNVGITQSEEVRLCQNAETWRQWLSQNGSRLQSGVRHRLGQPLDAKVAVDALSMPWVFPRLRVALANELGCVFGVRPFVEPDAPVLHQQNQLQAARAHALQKTAMAPGSWGIVR